MDRRIVVISTIRSHFLVNGKANDQFKHYIPKDGDTILISYDNNDDLHKQLDSLNSTKKDIDVFMSNFISILLLRYDYRLN
jgi:hypothetical protein